MKRHPAFQDLSRDHYVALNRSLQVMRAVEGHSSAQPYAQAIHNFAALWAHDRLREHFGEEETDLVPVLQARSAHALAARLLDEHAALRAAFAGVERDPDDREHAAATARSLTTHARWEEETVFEWLQANLSEAELQELAARSRSYRQAQGLPIGTPR